MLMTIPEFVGVAVASTTYVLVTVSDPNVKVIHVVVPASVPLFVVKNCLAAFGCRKNIRMAS